MVSFLSFRQPEKVELYQNIVAKLQNNNRQRDEDSMNNTARLANALVF
ncbi:MAG: hypothetical protein II131_03390 [Neisseriaceae bacterium]|nr:hypothetical protein [Neisseriaceae bacterium]